MSAANPLEEHSDRRPRALCLMGPTASGKTALAVALAERHGYAVISVDSALVYRGMDVGTAKPDPATLARVPHALVDIRDPEQGYSAAEFRADALRAMDEARENGRVPLLVGGTGLYFRALTRGLSGLPEADAGVRAALEAEARQRRLGGACTGAWRRPTHWPRRASTPTTRSGSSARSRSSRSPGNRSVRSNAAAAAVRPGASCAWSWALRTGPSCTRGSSGDSTPCSKQAWWRKSVACARGRACTPTCPAMRAVGYRQVWGYLDGDYGLDEAIKRGVHATRQLAKRQLTWLRSERDAVWIDPRVARAPTASRGWSRASWGAEGARRGPGGRKRRIRAFEAPNRDRWRLNFSPAPQ